MEKFNSEICYIESVLYSIEFGKLTSEEQMLKMKEVLNLKFSEIHQQGIRVGENNIKSQLESLNYTKFE